jgi:hypothetical protein
MSSRFTFLALAPTLGFGLACTGVGGEAVDYAEADRDVTFKRFQNQFDQSQVLDFVGEGTVQIYYGGRVDNRRTRTGTWSQNGREVQIWLEELDDVTDAQTVELWGRTIGQCSLAVYYREFSDGDSWSSGAANEDGGLNQPRLYHQSWPPCEAD